MKRFVKFLKQKTEKLCLIGSKMFSAINAKRFHFSSRVSGHWSVSCGPQSKALQIYSYGKQEEIHTRKRRNTYEDKIKGNALSQDLFCKCSLLLNRLGSLLVVDM